MPIPPSFETPSQRPRPLHERMQATQNAMNTPMECPRCGSTFFEDIHFQQFGRGGYGTAEFRLLSPVATPAKRCLCGYVVTPSPSTGKGGAGTDRAAFFDSAERMEKFLASQDIQKVVDVAASKRELEDIKKYLEERLSAVNKAIGDFEGRVSTLENPGAKDVNLDPEPVAEQPTDVVSADNVKSNKKKGKR